MGKSPVSSENTAKKQKCSQQSISCDHSTKSTAAYFSSVERLYVCSTKFVRPLTNVCVALGRIFFSQFSHQLRLIYQLADVGKLSHIYKKKRIIRINKNIISKTSLLLIAGLYFMIVSVNVCPNILREHRIYRCISAKCGSRYTSAIQTTSIK